MRPSAHFCAVAAGVICLIALAALLWETEEPCECVEAVALPSDFDPPEKRPAYAAPRVRVYNFGSTMIAPLVSDAFLAKRHISKAH